MKQKTVLLASDFFAYETDVLIPACLRDRSALPLANPKGLVTTVEVIFLNQFQL
ncbi:MAG: hypothetical protein OJF59_000418 [Cytophagales bacterium]|jgi:hypothetical protein|nr:MAG: hypothetical protein OJF59_000418 [Cytophagales bacterium]